MKIFKLALDIVNSLVALLYSLVLATLTSFGQLIDILFKPYSDLDVKNYLITGCVLSGISFVVFVLSIIDIAAIKNKKVYTAFEIGINITLLAVPVTISYIIT